MAVFSAHCLAESKISRVCPTKTAVVRNQSVRRNKSRVSQCILLGKILNDLEISGDSLTSMYLFL